MPDSSPIHRGLESFEARYGSERELLEQTWRELGYVPKPEKISKSTILIRVFS